jgi:hypothetical protein
MSRENHMTYKDENKNGIDDDFERRLFRDLFIIQLSGIIIFLMLIVVIGYLMQR